jgi:hypothetical protein
MVASLFTISTVNTFNGIVFYISPFLYKSFYQPIQKTHKNSLIFYFIQMKIFCQYVLCHYLQQILGQMAHNVPAVYDVLPARIRALRSKDQGWQNVAEFWRGNGA